MKVIKISQVIELLEKGLKRPEIAEELGLNLGEVKKLFLHPKLKGLKARKKVSFTIIDDVNEDQKVAVDNQKLEFTEENTATTEAQSEEKNVVPKVKNPFEFVKKDKFSKKQKKEVIKETEEKIDDLPF